MGSPETCDKCGGVGRHVEGKRGFTRFPCPNATPTPPAPADARPMVVGGAFVKFDRPAPAPDAGWEPWGNPYPRHPDVIRTRDLCLAICEKHQAFDAAAEIRVMHLPPAPDAGARIEEAHRALGKPGRMDDDGCCVGCGRSVQPSPCCPDFPVWPGPCRSCYAYDEEQRDAGAAERAVVEAARAVLRLLDKSEEVVMRSCRANSAFWKRVERLRAALRGTKGQAAPSPTDPKNPAPKATSADGCTEQKEP